MAAGGDAKQDEQKASLAQASADGRREPPVPGHARLRSTDGDSVPPRWRCACATDERESWIPPVFLRRAGLSSLRVCAGRVRVIASVDGCLRSTHCTASARRNGSREAVGGSHCLATAAEDEMSPAPSCRQPQWISPRSLRATCASGEDQSNLIRTAPLRWWAPTGGATPPTIRPSGRPPTMRRVCHVLRARGERPDSCRRTDGRPGRGRFAYIPLRRRVVREGDEGGGSGQAHIYGCGNCTSSPRHDTTRHDNARGRDERRRGETAEDMWTSLSTVARRPSRARRGVHCEDETPRGSPPEGGKKERSSRRLRKAQLLVVLIVHQASTVWMRIRRVYGGGREETTAPCPVANVSIYICADATAGVSLCCGCAAPAGIIRPLQMQLRRYRTQT